MSRPYEILYSDHGHPFSFFLSLNLKSCKHGRKKNLNPIYWEMTLIMFFISTSHRLLCVLSRYTSQNARLSFAHGHNLFNCTFMVSSPGFIVMARMLVFVWFYEIKVTYNIWTSAREETLLRAQNDYYQKVREESHKVCDVSTLKFVVENADQVIISYPMF